MNKKRPASDKADISEYELLKKNHKFVRDEEEDEKLDVKKSSKEDYGKILAKKYYDKLYKEYAVVDLSRYETAQIGMRWRIEKEVLSGKGESICASTKCSNKIGLGTYEVNFKYKEDGEVKNTLVKVRVCQECAEKLNHGKKYKKLD